MGIELPLGAKAYAGAAAVERFGMSKDIEALVVECVQRHGGETKVPITLDTPLQDLEIESLDFIEIIFDLEEALDIDIHYNANEAETMETVKDLAAKVVEMVEKNKTGKADKVDAT